MATHYHTDWVVPYWSASLDKVTEVNTHLFFRWTGWWGTPAAFTRAYAGAEPAVPLLARLSEAHRTGSLEEALAAGTIDPDDLAEAALPKPMTADPNSFLVALDKRMASDAFAALAVRTCGDRPYCKFMGWTDRTKLPAALPLSEEQIASMSFSYLRDQRMVFAKALWNCEEFKRPSPVQCMRQSLIPRDAQARLLVERPRLPAQQANVPRQTLTLPVVQRKADPQPAPPKVVPTVPTPAAPQPAASVDARQ
jgi:hypothetical protein